MIQKRDKTFTAKSFVTLGTTVSYLFGIAIGSDTGNMPEFLATVAIFGVSGFLGTLALAIVVPVLVWKALADLRGVLGGVNSVFAVLAVLGIGVLIWVRLIQG